MTNKQLLTIIDTMLERNKEINTISGDTYNCGWLDGEAYTLKRIREAITQKRK